ncbi:MAG: hypothetical protein AAGK00_14700 [Pseudomonadota bacterium]
MCIMPADSPASFESLCESLCARFAPRLRAFAQDDSAMVTIDWVALTAAILLVGMSTIYALFNLGVSPTVAGINTNLMTAAAVNVGPTPVLNTN